MTRRIVSGAAAALFTIVVTAGPVSATPSPPTNGGNGAGNSGQCTGPAADRPASCQSP